MAGKCIHVFDPAAVVHHVHQHAVLLLVYVQSHCSMRLAATRLKRILYQIDENLLDLSGTHGGRDGMVGDVQFESNVAEARLGDEKPMDRSRNFGHVDLGRLLSVRSAQAHEVLQQFPYAIQLADGELEVGAVLVVAALREELQKSARRREGIPDLVRDPGTQLGQCGHFLKFLQFLSHAFDHALTSPHECALAACPRLGGCVREVKREAPEAARVLVRCTPDHGEMAGSSNGHGQPRPSRVPSIGAQKGDRR